MSLLDQAHSVRRTIAVIAALALGLSMLVLAGTPATPSWAASTWSSSSLFPYQPVRAVDIDANGSGVPTGFTISPGGSVYRSMQSVSSLPGSQHENGVAGNWTTQTLYYPSQTAATMRVHDIATNTDSTVTLPQSGTFKVEASSRHNRVYLLNRARNSVIVYDVVGQSFSEITVGQNPVDMLLDDAGDRLYVSNPGSSSNTQAGTVSVIDTVTASVIATITVGVQPGALALDPAGSRLFVPQRSGASISIISTSLLSLSSTMSLAAAPTASVTPVALAYDGTRNLLWYLGNQVEVGYLNLGPGGGAYAVADAFQWIPGSNISPLSDVTVMRLHPTTGYPYWVASNGLTSGPAAIGQWGKVSERVAVQTSALPSATLGVAYSQPLSALGLSTDYGRSGNYVFSAVSGLTGTGLSLSSAGVLSGTPTVWGARNFVVTAQGDAGGWGTSAQATISLYIVPPPPSISTVSLAAGAVGVPYSASVVASYGEAWALRVGDQLPAGLSLNANTGAITGTPTIAGNTSFRVIVSNNQGSQSAYRDYTISATVNPPQISSATTWQRTPANAVSSNGWIYPALAAGSPSATWSISAGALPAGLSLDTSVPANVRVTGTITAPVGSNYSFTLRATNAASGLYDEKIFTGTIVASAPAGWGTSLDGFVATPFLFSPLIPFAGYQGVTGSAPMSWSIDPSSPDQLPGGLTLNPATGTITGNPTAQALAATGANGPGGYSIVLAVSNAAGNITVPYDIYLHPTPTAQQTIAISELAPISAQPVTPVGAPAAIAGTWGETLGSAMPSWLGFDGNAGGNTGAMSGQAPRGSAGSYDFVVNYFDGSATRYQRITLTVAAAPVITPTAPALPATIDLNWQVGSQNSYAISPTAGSSPLSFSLASGSPSWVSLAAQTGLLSGAPTVAGTSTLTLSVSNSVGTATTVITVHALVAPNLGTVSPPAATVGLPYSYAVPATGSGPLSFLLTGTLPAGLSFNPITGVISGTPTGIGQTGSFTITVSNAVGNASSTPVTLASAIVAPVAPATAVLSSVNLAGVSYTFAQSGGSPATSYTSTGLPAWASFIGGVLSGTPTSSGTFSFTLTGSNQAGSASTTVSLTVTGPPVIASTLTAPAFGYGLPGSYPLVATGTPAPISYAAANLPNWLSLDAQTGLFTGTPPIGTPSPVVVSVTVSNGVGSPTPCTVTIPLTTIAPQLPATLTVPPIGPGTVASYPVVQSAGTPVTFALAAGTPSWVSIDPATGLVSFTNPPASAVGLSPWSITVLGQNAAGTAQSQLAVTVSNIPILPATLNYVIAVGTPFSHDLATDITAGNGPFSWADVTPGGLPSWLSLSGSTLTGTPLSAQVLSLALTVTNASGTNWVSVTITAAVAPSWLAAPQPPSITVGVPYQYTLPTPSGTGPFAFTLTGTLPAGLAFNPTTGTISGSATAAMTSPVTFSASNVLGASQAASASATLVASVVSPQPAPAQTLTATTTAALSFSAPSIGGSPVTTWSLGAGAPAGLTIDPATGVVSGTPAQPGSYSFTVIAQNAGGTASTPVSLTVSAPPTVAPIGALYGPVGVALSYLPTITANGSTAHFSIDPATPLPTWASLDPITGVISGTPTGALAPINVTLIAQNAAGTTRTSFTLGSAVPPSFSSATPPAATQGVSYRFVVPTPSGTSPFVYSVVGSLPSGLSLNPTTGVISGTPTQASTGRFTVIATGPLGSAYSAAMGQTITVQPASSSGPVTPVTSGGNGASHTANPQPSPSGSANPGGSGSGPSVTLGNGAGSSLGGGAGSQASAGDKDQSGSVQKPQADARENGVSPADGYLALGLAILLSGALLLWLLLWRRRSRRDRQGAGSVSPQRGSDTW